MGICGPGVVRCQINGAHPVMYKFGEVEDCRLCVSRGSLSICWSHFGVAILHTFKGGHRVGSSIRGFRLFPSASVQVRRDVGVELELSRRARHSIGRSRAN